MLNLRFTVALLLVIVSLSISIGGGFVTKNIAMQLLDTTNVIASSSDSSQIREAAELLVSQWREKKQILSLFLDVNRTEQIVNLVLQIYAAAMQEDSNTLETVCMQLSQQLQAVIEQERISLYNLF